MGVAQSTGLSVAEGSRGLGIVGRSIPCVGTALRGEEALDACLGVNLW